MGYQSILLNQLPGLVCQLVSFLILEKVRPDDLLRGRDLSQALIEQKLESSG